MSKTFSFSLDENEISKAIKELEQYKKDFSSKYSEFCNRVAEKIKEYAQEGFDGAIVDDLTGQNSPIQANVQVEVTDNDDVTLVIANGEDAVWVEFGAGVYHNGSVGSSPNPYGSKLGFTIGGYGTKGKQKIWGFRQDGRLVLTHGTPAKMPMFHAVQQVIQDVDDIAKEVFV